MFADVTVTNFPPTDQLPADVASTIAARDAAYDALDNFEVEYSDYLSETWESTFEAHDVQAGIDAVSAGKALEKLRSSLAAARDRRPTILGAHRALTTSLREAESAAQKAFRAVVGTLEPAADERLRETAEKAQDAYRAYLAAREAFGGAANVVRFVRAWQNGDRPDYSADGASPALANGLAPDSHEPLVEIREVLGSFALPFEPDPLVLVVAENGSAFELKRSLAEALAGSANSAVRIIEVDA
ncbi:hypothetical protein [Streptomyces sp. NPDC054834]